MAAVTCEASLSKAFGARHQNHILVSNGGTRGTDALHREGRIIKPFAVQSAVFDGKSRNARRHRQADIDRDTFGRVGETGFEIGIDRQIGGAQSSVRWDSASSRVTA
jgi:hypothetical protein